MRSGLLIIGVAAATAALAACSSSGGTGVVINGVNHDIDVSMLAIVPDTVSVGPKDTITWHARDSVHVIKFNVPLSNDSVSESRAFRTNDTVMAVIAATASAASVSYTDTVSGLTGVVVVVR